MCARSPVWAARAHPLITMKQRIRDKLEHLANRLEELDRALASEDAARDMNAFRDLSRERAEIEPVVRLYHQYRQAEADCATACELLADAEMRELGELELAAGEARIAELEADLQRALLPRDANDERNLFLEIRAGTGGDEAALFAGDLLRMYLRYAEKRGWAVTVQSENTTELGGVKDVQIAIRAKGTPAPEDGVWASMKYEGGVHRVQRIPVTESQGRIQTSAAGVIVFPEADEDDDEIEIDPKDLKIDIFMSSGPGGQSVNTTYSAVRMTHLPTGITVNMQDEKSQIQNRAAALRVLKSRLLAMKHEQEAAEAADMRHSQVRSLDRSERIRTYNFPENRIVDHRTNYKAYNLDAVLDGDLQAVIDSDIQADEADRLANQQ